MSLLAAVAAAAALALSGCAGATRTVTVTHAPAAATHSTPSATPTSTAPAATTATDTAPSDTTNTDTAPADTTTTDSSPTPPADTSTTDTTGADPSTADSGSGPIPTVPVGTNQTLSADQENDQIDTTVTAVQDLAPDQFNQPNSGMHYVGVFVKYHNMGATTFDDSPDNDVTLITNADNTISADVADVGGCSNDGDLKVGPGETLRTCVTFQEPNDQHVKTVEVSLDSGNDAPGEWSYP